MRLAANLRPNFRVRLQRQVAERTILRSPSPFRDADQLRLLGGREKLARLLQRAFEPPRAKIILPALHQRGLELDRQDLLQDRDVLVEQLLLQIDRLRRDDGFFLLLEGEQDRRDEVGDRFSHAGSGFHHQVLLLLERLGDSHRHLLLLSAILEILRLREQAGLGENRPDALDEIAAESFFQRNHADRRVAQGPFRVLLREQLARESCAPAAEAAGVQIIQPHFANFAVRLLDRYVLQNFLQAYLYCIAAFISIWLIFDISDNISTFLDDRISLGMVVNYYLTQVPQILVILLPISLLLALLFSLGRMSRTNEIVSMLTAGVSVPRLLLPLIVMGLLTAGVSGALNYSLAPHAEQAKKNYFDGVRGGVREFWGQIFRNRADNRTWFIQRFRPDQNDLLTVQVLQQDENDNIVKSYSGGERSLRSGGQDLGDAKRADRDL